MFKVEGLGTRGFFLMHPGQPLPGEGVSLAQVSAVGRLLYLGRAQPAQEGTYTCECSNVAGNSSQDQQLVVYGESDWDDLDQAEGAGRGQPEGWATRHPGRADLTPQNPSKDRSWILLSHFRLVPF